MEPGGSGLEAVTAWTESKMQLQKTPFVLSKGSLTYQTNLIKVT
jgi:hypothetical protein